VYSLVLGQCTTVLLNKMKQDADWQAVSDSYDPLKLLKLTEKFILEQSSNKYKIGIVIKQLKLLLVYRQDDGVTNSAYYDPFKTRVDVAEHIGVSFDNYVLWNWKSQELYSTDYDLPLDTVKEANVKEDVKQAFLSYLFFININDKKPSQLKKTLVNDHAKGNAEAYPRCCHAALTLMNNFKPLVIKSTAPVAVQGIAFAQKQKQKVAGTPATECNYIKEYFADKECHNCGKKGQPARCCTNKEGKAKKDSEDDKSVSSSKLIKSLTKPIKTLKKLVSALQAHQEDSSVDSSLSSEDGEEHFQYAYAAIETTYPKVVMALKSHKAQDLDLSARCNWDCT
jgi:hypothetical protein